MRRRKKSRRSKLKSRKSKSPRLGVFGATFDPLHIGHLIAAEFAREQLKLDQVLMIPASLNPLKQNHTPALSEIRLEMLKAALENYPEYNISDIELNRGGVSYTIDTILQLLKDYDPETSFYLLMGADAAAEFNRWKDYRKLSELCIIAVFNRPGAEMATIAKSLEVPFVQLKMPLIEVSSTMIRRRVAEGKSIKFLTTPSVIDIIEREKLYRSK